MEGERIVIEKDGTETFYVEIQDISYLLMAPPRDIFSKLSYVYMGESVVDRLLEQFRHEKGLINKRHRLVLLMPKEKITPGLSKECEAALDRFTATKIRDNQNAMAAIRRRGLLMIPYAMIFLIGSVGLGALFGTEIIPGIPSVWAQVLSEGLFIVAWVAMWGPLDTLLFGRFPFRIENQALRALEKTAIEVRPIENAFPGKL